MWPFIVIKIQIVVNASASISWTCVVFEIDFLVLNRTPQSLGNNIIQRTVLPVHTNFNGLLLEKIQIVRTREMTALITVHDLQSCLRECIANGLRDEPNLQRLLQGPADDVT